MLESAQTWSEQPLPRSTSSGQLPLAGIYVDVLKGARLIVGIDIGQVDTGVAFAVSETGDSVNYLTPQVLNCGSPRREDKYPKILNSELESLERLAWLGKEPRGTCDLCLGFDFLPRLKQIIDTKIRAVIGTTFSSDRIDYVFIHPWEYLAIFRREIWRAGFVEVEDYQRLTFVNKSQAEASFIYQAYLSPTEKAQNALLVQCGATTTTLEWCRIRKAQDHQAYGSLFLKNCG